MFRGEDGKPMEFYDAAIGGRSVGVPGTVAGLAAPGTWTFGDLAAMRFDTRFL